MQKKYGSRVGELEKLVGPTYEKIKAQIDVPELQEWLKRELEENMKKSIDGLKSGFD